jgi:hypothetical protein
VTFTFWKLYVLELLHCLQLRYVTLRHVTFTLCCFTLCSNIYCTPKTYSSMSSGACFRPIAFTTGSHRWQGSAICQLSAEQKQRHYKVKIWWDWFMDFALYVLFLNACPLPLKKYLLFKCSRRANKWEILNLWETRPRMCQVLYVLCSFLYLYPQVMCAL